MNTVGDCGKHGFFAGMEVSGETRFIAALILLFLR
jgi:hypothetical protein